MANADQDRHYEAAAAEFGPALARLTAGYEADRERRRDLLQDIHLALWRSFALFDGRCSVRTWVYRVAHNAAASYVAARRRAGRERLLDLEALDRADPAPDPEECAGQAQLLARLGAMIRTLKPPDAQVMLLYLEDMEAAEIAEVTGLSPAAVAVRIHRIKAILSRQFQKGGDDGR